MALKESLLFVSANPCVVIFNYGSKTPLKIVIFLHASKDPAGFNDKFKV